MLAASARTDTPSADEARHVHGSEPSTQLQLPGLLKLPEPVWRTRHRWVTTVLLAHLPALAGWAALCHVPPALGAWLAVPAVLYLMAAAEQLTRSRLRVHRAAASAAAAAGLMACSSYLVAVSGGMIETHFHFFVMVPVVALYEAWAPFSVAVAWVLLEHGLVGTIWPDRVFGQQHQHMSYPWTFAGVHAAFFAAACLGSLTAWSLAERARWVQQDLLEELRHRTMHDDLTGLANRTNLAGAMSSALSSGLPVAVLALDLDKFKEVNDTLGHAAGDELLRAVAARATASIAGAGLVVRLGGDEFAALLPGHGPKEAMSVAKQLRTAIGRSCTITSAGADVSVNVSVGIAHRPATGPATATRTRSLTSASQVLSSAGGGALSNSTAGSLKRSAAAPVPQVPVSQQRLGDQLLREADVAMYSAKKSGAGVSIYDASTDQHTPVRLTGLSDLQRALVREDQILVHFQPQFSLTTGQLVGAEALARWEHPTRGLLPPSEFIAMATSPDLDGAFTHRVLDAALAQARRWVQEGHLVPVSVNVPLRSLLRPSFAFDVLAVLASHKVPAQLLCLEVTEDALTSDAVPAAEALSTLRVMGVRCSMDDFGTGSTSLSLVRQLPLDEIKIDRSFVAALFPHGPGGPVDEVLIGSIIDLGHRLGLRVVAGGVEDDRQLDVLRRLGCDAAQGYLFCPPVPAAEFPADLLRRAAALDLISAWGPSRAAGEGAVAPNPPSRPLREVIAEATENEWHRVRPEGTAR